MKKLLDFVIPAALLFLSAGCVEDLQYESPIEGPVTRRYELSFDVPTKTALEGNKHVKWAVNDTIYYYTEQMKDQGAGASVRLENGIGYIDLQLDGPNDLYLNAFYSGQSNKPTSSNPIRTEPAREQKSFTANGVAKERQKNIHSFAEVHACAAHLADLESSTIHFRSIVSIFKFTLDDESVQAVVFSSPDETQIINGGAYGIVKVSMTTESLLSSVARDTDYTLVGPNKIVVETTDGTGDYYFAILPSYLSQGFLLDSYSSTTISDNTLIKSVRYEKSLVAGIDENDDFSPSIINLGTYSDWKNTIVPKYPVRDVQAAPSTLNFILDGEAQSQEISVTVTGDAQTDKTISWDLPQGGDSVVSVVKKSFSESDGVTVLTVSPVGVGSTTLTISSIGKDIDGNSISREVHINVSEPDPDLGVDLSAKETANCYIVNQNSGKYRFNANVKGNSTESVGTPESVKVLWESRHSMPTATTISKGDVVSSVSLGADGYVSFEAKGYGSALIAVQTAQDSTLWSWHIWVWEDEYDPATCYHTYKNSAGWMMDRDLGADANYPTTTQAMNKSAYGLLYQWGRKDPFFGSDNRVDTGNIPVPKLNSTIPVNSKIPDGEETIQYAIAHPDVYILHSETNRDWVYGSLRYNSLWGDTKTMYDPCPPGWKVPPANVWSKALGYSGNRKYTQAKNERQGLNFSGVMASEGLVFYQSSGFMNGTMDGSYYASDLTGATQNGYWWSNTYDSSTNGNTNNGRAFTIVNREQMANTAASISRSFACNVRCIWDSTVSPQGQTPQTTPVTSVTLDEHAKLLAVGETLALNATVLPENASNRAVRWDTGSVAVATVTSSGLVTAVGAGSTEITVSSVADPTIFDKCVITVGAPDQGGVTDLSAAGRANSYIVSLPGKYAFNCKFKGNSSVAISPVRATWLWMSDGTDTAPGDIITDLNIEGDYITFTVPGDMKSGNVVIAALDQSGAILWSWHIWACIGFDPDDYAHTYYNGSIMMDRNLGATSATVGDIHAVGLMYQWGRKDPFRGVVNPQYQVDNFAAARISGYMNWDNPLNTSLSEDALAYSIHYPMHFILSNQKRDWMNTSNANLWSGVTKTMYDPCPPGWMMPSGGENGIFAKAFAAGDPTGSKTLTAAYNTNLTFGGTYTNIFREGSIWFPFAGFIWPHTGTLGETGGNDLRVWTGTVYSSYGAYTLSQKDAGFSFTSQNPRSYGASVRCAKVIPVTGITPIASTLELKITKDTSGNKVFPTHQFTTGVLPSYANNYNITWSSSATTVAAVNSTGYVTTKAKGECVITAKTQDGNFTTTCTITVKDADNE